MAIAGRGQRRTKVIGRFPGETGCLTLVWAVLDLYISHATNGIKFAQLERRHLKRMRYLVSDNVGNQVTYTSASVVKVDTTAKFTAIMASLKSRRTTGPLRG